MRNLRMAFFFLILLLTPLLALAWDIEYGIDGEDFDPNSQQSQNASIDSPAVDITSSFLSDGFVRYYAVINGWCGTPDDMSLTIWVSNVNGNCQLSFYDNSAATWEPHSMLSGSVAVQVPAEYLSDLPVHWEIRVRGGNSAQVDGFDVQIDCQ